MLKFSVFYRLGWCKYGYAVKWFAGNAETYILRMQEFLILLRIQGALSTFT